MVRRFPMWVAAAGTGLVLVAASAAGQSTMDSTAKPASHEHMKSASSAAGGSDSHFVLDAAKGGLAEVEMGRLAAEKASSPDVKQFGQRMVDDHSKANDELKAVASQKGLTLPTELAAADKATLDRLSKLSGEAFDRAYMSDMVKDHRKDVAEFKKEATAGKDADVKAFAGKTLPTLEEHLKMAQDVHGKVMPKKVASKASAAKKTS